MKRIIGINILLYIVCATSFAEPFQLQRDPSYGRFTVFGDLSMEVPVAKLAVAEDLFLEINLRHRIKQRDYGPPISSWYCPLLLTSVYPGSSGTLVWRLPGGEILTFREYPDGSYRAREWLLQRGEDGRDEICDTLGWQFLYHAGQLESAKTPSGAVLNFVARAGMIREIYVTYGSMRRTILKCVMNSFGEIAELQCGVTIKLLYDKTHLLRVVTDAHGRILLQSIYSKGMVSRVKTPGTSDWEDVEWERVDGFFRGDNLWPTSVRAIKCGERRAEYSEKRDVLVARITEPTDTVLLRWNMRSNDVEIHSSHRR